MSLTRRTVAAGQPSTNPTPNRCSSSQIPAAIQPKPLRTPEIQTPPNHRRTRFKSPFHKITPKQPLHSSSQQQFIPPRETLRVPIINHHTHSLSLAFGRNGKEIRGTRSTF
ncbi:hypothetical protein Droror1_Dr00007405 [Drosera rotundifolia]